MKRNRALPWFVASIATISLPASALERFYVNDSSGGKIWIVADLNADGDYDDAGEVAVF